MSKKVEDATDPKSLDIEERRSQIIAMVNAEQFVSVTELAKRFQVSFVTIRSDIEALVKNSSKFRRVRGGIMKSQTPYAETPFEARSSLEFEQKVAIGKAAAEMISSNDTIILDVGTTTMAIAEALIQRTDIDNVTIFTNGLNIAMALEQAWPRLQTVVTGGSVRPLQHSLVEPMASIMLRQIKAGRAFLGCNGIDPSFGITTTNLPEAEIKRTIIQAAMEVIVAADASKFGRTALARICAIDEVDCFLTAGVIETHCARQLEELGCKINNVAPTP